MSNTATQGRPALKAVAWNSRKTICSVEAVSAEGATIVPDRLSSSVGEPGVVGAQGKGRVVLDEVDDLMNEMVSVVLRREGQKVAEEQLKFGEVWHAA